MLHRKINQAMTTGTRPSTDIVCHHCGAECKEAIRSYDAVFCCTGCKMVYGLLHDKGLCDYYLYNEKPGISMQAMANSGKFDYLDNTDVEQKLLLFRNAGQSHVRFYLPQMHCSSCLFLLENLYRIDPAIISARVDFVKKEAFIVYDHNEISMSGLACLLASIGYEPYISLSDSDVRNVKKADREKVYKLGIAGFCFANIMMMSLPEYFAGGIEIEQPIRIFLRYAMLGLSLPVVFYSGQEFFVSAWSSLKERYLNIDAPIALAIAITFFRSLYEIFWGTGSGYLDSMSGIIFFMLVGRLLQDQAYKSLSFDRDFRSFFPIAVRWLNDGKVTSKTIEQVEADDVLIILPDEIIPVDGIVSKGKALIDYSFVTGESLPVEVGIGELVYAGGKQTGEKIEVIAVKTVSQSYLTNLWNRNAFKDKSVSRSFIDLLSRHFTLILMAIASLTAAYWLSEGRQDIMWHAVTSMFIIACPCALLLTATFTFGRLMRLYGKNGLYLRHHDVVEHMSDIDHIVFDKTGTLTDHFHNKVVYSGATLTEEEKAIISALAGESSHPLSRAIADHMASGDEIRIESFKNHPGLGIEAWYNDCHYKLGSSAFTGTQSDQQVIATSMVYVSVDGKIRGSFSIRNSYRSGIELSMAKLKGSFKVTVLSGDHEGEKDHLDRLIGPGNQSYFMQGPQQKLEYIKTLQTLGHKVMMIGDGLNDAGALKQSEVGIAVSDSVNNFTPAADGILDGARLVRLPEFMRLAKSGRNIILFTFAVSIVYNIAGLWFAVQGMLSPMVAAILMPLSSLTIIFLTYTLSGIVGRFLKLND